MEQVYDSYKDSGIPWIGEIPSEWNICRLKNAGRMYGGLTGKTASDFKVEETDFFAYFIPFSNIFNNTVIEIDALDKVKVYAGEKQNKVVHGDILFLMSSEDYDGIGKSAIYLSDTSKAVYLNSFCKGLRTKKNLFNAIYLNYMMYCSIGRVHCQMSANGYIRINLRQDKLLNAQILFPPLIEQQAIASYLDEKCADIDELVSLQEEMIKELEAYKQSIITEAVTKGLNPNVPMKDSGIPWIGKIPSQWNILRIKHALSWKSEKGHGNAQVLSLYRDFGVIPKDSRDDNHNVTSEKTEEYKFVCKGDFVVNKMKAWQGSMALSSFEGIVSPAYYVFSFRNEHIYKPYFHYLLRNESYLPEYRRLSTGLRIGQWDLGYEDFKEIQFLLPSIIEQQSIASFLDEKCTDIDALISLRKKKIEELKEFKKSVIFEAVTGKIKVV